MSDEDETTSRLFAPAGEALIAAVGWIAAAIAALFSFVALGTIFSALNPGNIFVQDGQRDLLGAAKLSVLLLVPVWVLAHVPVLGSMTCSSGEMGFLGTVIVGGLQLVAFVFIGKGMLQGMWTLSTGDPDLGSPILSITAGILPIVLGAVVTIDGTSLLSCLFP